MTENNNSGVHRAPERNRQPRIKPPAPLEQELHGCFRFFWDNFSRGERTYGLMPDRVPDIKHKCSVASNGFMLAAMAVGADFHWVDFNSAKTVCDRTLSTLLGLQQSHGFLYHFYSGDTGERYKQSELSTIDTALLFCGALTAGSYFGGSTLKLARRLVQRADWNYFYDPQRKQFRMAYYDGEGLHAWWDYYAEQLVIYVLAAAGNGWQFARDAYENLGRLQGKAANGQPFVHTWFGSLFAHQFSHAFVDFRGKTDSLGMDWFANSVTASLNDIVFCEQRPKLFPQGVWGLTSCAVPGGYRGNMGCPPSGNNDTEHFCDGTVAPCAALGSIVFTPQQSLKALEQFDKYPKLQGKYGLYDSFNPSQGCNTTCYIGIDKGITLLMGANYCHNTVWKYFNSLSEIRHAMSVLGFTQRQTTTASAEQIKLK